MSVPVTEAGKETQWVVIPRDVAEKLRSRMYFVSITDERERGDQELWDALDAAIFDQHERRERRI